MLQGFCLLQNKGQSRRERDIRRAYRGIFDNERRELK
nr:MAG TPA: hypothetical protein [Caudoviricetes sp.]DAQ08693.1 MAG TPA: hypothetical protein [Caudoviricetes sp.]